MLRTTLRALPKSTRPACPACSYASFHTTHLLRAERAPTFTTPDPTSTTKTGNTEPHDPTKPLPSTEIPVEDYASPTMHTFSFFAQLFRYAVFGSVAVVVVAVSTIAGVHAYVEVVALKASPDDSGEIDSSSNGEQWTWDHLGWSGTEKGGTDPRLGFVARSQVRSAWLAEHWGGAGMPAAIAGNVRISPAQAGGAFVGSNMTERAINDPSWLLSETYLLLALKRAASQGLTLNTSDGGIDRPVFELEQRLARIRTKIGGKALYDAREGYEKMYYALEATPNKTPRDKKDLLHITTKLGEVYQRLGQNATGRWTGGLVKALAQPGETIGATSASVSEEPVKHATPKSSFFAFWSRSHPTPVSKQPNLPPTPEASPIDSLLAVLGSANASTFSPSMRRAVLDTLTKLETALAKSRQLHAAQRLQLAANRFADEAVRITSSATTGSLTRLSHLVSSSTLQAHLAEVSLALNDRSIRAEELLDDSIEKVTNVLVALEQDFKTTRSPAVEEGYRKVEKDAKRAGAISAALGALVREGKCRRGDRLSCDRARALYEMACRWDPLDPAPRKGVERLSALQR